MKRDRLKPYVYKVKGEQNYALYDLFHGKIFQIIPEGEPEELRKELLNEDLIFESEGIVPYKIKIDLTKEFSELYIKELQLRLDGVCEDSCWSRKVAKKNGKRMEKKIVDILLDQLQYLDIKLVRIETDEHDEYIKKLIIQVVSTILSERIEIYSAKRFNNDDISFLMDLSTKTNTHLEIKRKEKIELSELDINIYRFFYSRNFNPCLGHKIAVDTNGDIKPCLWLNEVIANIKTSNIKDLITAGQFSPYWELSKRLIEECSRCELRYACNDCRIYSKQGYFSKDKKPLFCKY